MQVAATAASAADLMAARTQMAVSLGWHIIVACLGVGFPLLVLIAEWRGLRTGDPAWRLLARRWGRTLGVLFAVGAVSGTILSFELGILWPGMMGTFGEVIGLPFAIEGVAFFTEAIFLGIYLYAWDRLPPRVHMLTAVPIVIAGVAGAFFVVAANSWMNQPRGFDLVDGADFGAGAWDLIAGGAHGGARQRALIEHSIGPVWEANHVWLIFALVMLWTGFPTAFAAIMSTLYIPLTAVAFGVILRGAAFAFRKAVSELWLKRLFGACFAASSVITPFFLGTVAGAVATGRVPPGTALGQPISSWVNPTSLLGGVLAVGVCAYLAAVYLTNDARRTGDHDLTEWFRVRALAAGLVVGLIALGGIGILRADAPRLFDGLTGRALPLVVASALFGAASLFLLARRRLVAVRVTAALAVVAIIWGWAVAQYPYLLEPDLTIAQAASSPVVMQAVLVSLAVGSLLLVPSLALLFALFQREHTQELAAGHADEGLTDRDGKEAQAL
jgi:cytochrome bd ubiquinol oxidase subunit II